MAMIYYGPPEAAIDTETDLRNVGAQAGNPFQETSGGEDLNGWLFGTSQEWNQEFSNWLSLSNQIQVLVEWATNFVGWIIGQFEGVPEQAKTIGTGFQLTQHNNPVTPFLGGMLVAGGAAGAALSDPNWPENFGGRFVANAGAMIEFTNREPPGSPWRIRNTPQSSITKYGDPPVQYRLYNVVPPTNAPYSDSITIDGIFSEAVRQPADYLTRFNFPVPTPSQIDQFLHDTGGIVSADKRVPTGTLVSMRTTFLTLWVDQYAAWLLQNEPAPPGPIPNPCQLPADPPCPQPASTSGDQLTQLINAIAPYLYYITNNLTALANAAYSPQEQVCCANLIAAVRSVTTQISLLQNQLLNNPAPTIDLSQIVLQLTNGVIELQNVDKDINALAGHLVGPLQAIAGAIGDASGGTDVSGIVQALDQANTLNDVPPAVLQQFVTDKALPGQYAQFLQGTPAEIVKAIIGAAGLISSPSDVAKLLSGDSSDLTGVSKTAYDDVVREFPAVFNALKPIVSADSKTLSALLQVAFSKYLTANDTVIEPIITPLLNALKGQLTPPAGTVPSTTQIGVSPDAPVASATGIVLSAAIASWIASGFGVEHGESLVKMVEIIGGAIGFEEIRDVQIGPLIRQGIGAVAELNAKATFRQWVPSIGELGTLYARGLITKQNYEFVQRWNAVQDSWFGILESASYHGLQPRQLIRAFESGLFTSADLTDEMTFSGMRPASQQRMLALAPYLATAPQRSAYKAAAMESFEKGLLTSAQLNNYLAGAEHLTDPLQLEGQTAIFKLGIANTLALQDAYTKLFVQGFNDLPTYEANLTGIGLSSQRVSVLVAIAETQQTLVQQRQQAAAEKSLMRQTVTAERRAAMKNYQVGAINDVALSAALVATGLTAVQAAAWVDLAELQKGGNLRWIYGVQLAPADAQILEKRVSALTDQRKREQITGTQYITALQQLGLSEPFQNALLASANSLITPKTDAITTPVETGVGSLRRG